MRLLLDNKNVHFILLFLALGFGTPTPALASQLPVPIYASTTEEDIILAYAVHYGIKGDEFLKTLECESGLNKNAVGDHGESFGVAQIHLVAALDPMFSIDWAAHQFALGNANIWTCHRQLYGSRTD